MVSIVLMARLCIFYIMSWTVEIRWRRGGVLVLAGDWWVVTELFSDSLSSPVSTDENLKVFSPRIAAFVAGSWRWTRVTLEPAATQDLLCSMMGDH